MSFLENIDKNRLQKILLFVISALVLAALVCMVVIIISSLTPASAPGDTDFEYNNITLTNKDVTTGTLLIVNGNHKYNIPSNEDLGLVSLKDYRTSQTPKDAEIPYSVTTGVLVNDVAAANIHLMLIDMLKATGTYDAPVTSGFRTLETQTSIGGVAPGHSDHHTGMLFTIDFTAKGQDSKEDKAAQKDWLSQNAHKYGIVVRYPADKASVTGVSDYTYAYRYVGAVHATYMKDNALCLEEYVEYLKTNTDSENAISVTVDGVSYAVYYAAGTEGSTVKVPAEAEYTLSGTNEGGVIVTVKLTK